MSQLTLRQQQLINIGIQKALIEISGTRIKYLIQSKEYDFTDPEEPVRAATYVELCEHYQYPPQRIDFEKEAPSRQPPYPADIIVYWDDAHSRAFIIVECKPTSQPADLKVAQKEGLGNANLFHADYLVVACGDALEVYDVRVHPTLRGLGKCRISDLLIGYAKPPQFKYRKGGDVFEEPRRVSLYELQGKFQKCHDAIWEAGKRGPDEAFDEMSKLMFAKIYDERFTRVGEYYHFQVGAGENNAPVVARVKARYQSAKQGEPAILQDDIQVSDDIIYRVVRTLEDISLTKTDLDAKGTAFESFLGKVFRGELGQFFTPRQVIDFMVKFVDPNWDDIVMDPACGSGGFLLYSIQHVIERVCQQFVGNETSIERIVWDFSHTKVFGIEINRRIARIAMMDMVIHDDGHTNIECNDALLNYSEFDPRRDIQPGKYNVVLTNPPFGAREERSTVLGSFQLGRDKNTQRSELLYIERALDLVKESGMVGIVLPDGVLNNVNDRNVRAFIDEKAIVVGVVSLPVYAFVPFGSGMQTSILFLQKRGKNSQHWGSYPVFMGIALNIGYDSTGRDIPSNDLASILDAYKTHSVTELADWINPQQLRHHLTLQELKDTFTIDRMDPKYYHLATEIDQQLSKIKHPPRRLADLSVTIKSGTRPPGRAMYFRGNVPSLEGGNINSYGGLLLDDLKYIPDDFHIDHLESAIEPADILIVKDGATTGKVAIIPEMFPYQDANINEHLFKVRVDTRLVDPYYVFAFLYSELGQLQMQREITGGAQKGIIKSAIENLLVPHPPKAIQELIADLAQQALHRIVSLHAETADTQHRMQTNISASLQR